MAKLKGTYKGRVKGSKESDSVVLSKYRGVVKELKRGTSLRRTARFEGVALGTVQKVRKILNKQLVN